MKKSPITLVAGTLTVLLGGVYLLLNWVPLDLPWLKQRTEGKWAMVGAKIRGFIKKTPRKVLTLTFPDGNQFQSSLGILDQDTTDNDGDQRFILRLPGGFPDTVVSAQFDGDEGVVELLPTGLICLRFPRKKVWLLHGDQEGCLQQYLLQLMQQAQQDQLVWSGLFDCPQNCPVQVSIIAGIAGLEGPYPEWKLPRVCWGLGPQTELELAAATAGKIQLDLRVRNHISGQQLTFLLNGDKITTIPFAVQNYFVPIVLPLAIRQGTNRLVIQYSQWEKNDHGDTRPMAVLYSRFSISGRGDP